MPQNDTHLALASDIPAALGLLSRLPVKVNQEAAQQRGAAAAWAYPIAGAIIGFVAVLAGWLSMFLGLPDIAVAGITLATLVMVTGAMHEDGLADTFDGLWGGYTVERRLEIMKDSSIGAYGVVALALSIAVRFGLIYAIVRDGNLIALVGIAALSRAPMVVLMAKMENARKSGLSRSVGRPRIETALLAVLVALTIGFVVLWGTILHGVLIAAIAVFALGIVAQHKIHGQTGDILGASQQFSEIAFLAATVTALST
ncbi:adenosylcobinamide-GDP ribazoletransferase [Falsihalocynthiibacter sp. SS001]|uniref:adenosylcobinamide-GDP ribazoletransferase n=1 Tax=Falsihalocynthiibacter sp. SS001 TaxID=3349698 RepID=UPI0036D3B4CC